MSGEFDEMLELFGNQIPDDVKDSAVWVHDTLFVCEKIARQRFGEQVNSDYVFAIYDRVVDRLQEKVNREDRLGEYDRAFEVIKQELEQKKGEE